MFIMRLLKTSPPGELVYRCLSRYSFSGLLAETADVSLHRLRRVTLARVAVLHHGLEIRVSQDRRQRDRIAYRFAEPRRERVPEFVQHELRARLLDHGVVSVVQLHRRSPAMLPREDGRLV